MSPRSITAGLIASAIALAACRGDTAERGTAGAPTATAAAPAPSTASQLDLARELDAADAGEAPDVALAQVRTRWQGKRLRWTVTRQAALCRTAETCNVLPFPLPRPAAVAGHGWMPALAFAPGQFDRLTAACGAAPLCELTFEGKLAELAVSAEEPTALRFADVVVVSAGAAASRSET